MSGGGNGQHNGDVEWRRCRRGRRRGTLVTCSYLFPSPFERTLEGGRGGGGSRADTDQKSVQAGRRMDDLLAFRLGLG